MATNDRFRGLSVVKFGGQNPASAFKNRRESTAIRDLMIRLDRRKQDEITNERNEGLDELTLARTNNQIEHNADILDANKTASTQQYNLRKTETERRIEKEKTDAALALIKEKNQQEARNSTMKANAVRIRLDNLKMDNLNKDRQIVEDVTRARLIDSTAFDSANATADDATGKAQKYFGDGKPEIDTVEKANAFYKEAGLEHLNPSNIDEFTALRSGVDRTGRDRNEVVTKLARRMTKAGATPDEIKKEVDNYDLTHASSAGTSKAYKTAQIASNKADYDTQITSLKAEYKLNKKESKAVTKYAYTQKPLSVVAITAALTSEENKEAISGNIDEVMADEGVKLAITKGNVTEKQLLELVKASSSSGVIDSVDQEKLIKDIKIMANENELNSKKIVTSSVMSKPDIAKYNKAAAVLIKARRLADATVYSGTVTASGITDAERAELQRKIVARYNK